MRTAYLEQCEMDIEVSQPAAGVCKVVLCGRLDTPGVDKVETRFTAAATSAQNDVVVDLSGVTFLASMGIRMLISAARSKQNVKRRFVLFGAQPLVREVLDHVSIDLIVPVVADEQQALAKIG